MGVARLERPARRRLRALKSTLTPSPAISSIDANAPANMPLIPSSGKDRVILGTMTFGPDESKGARITSLDEYNRCLDYLQQQGYNELDTARMYISGAQEAFTRDAKWKSRGLTLATKVHPVKAGGHAAGKVKEALSTSLKELGTDCVDIYYLHAPDHTVPYEETLQALNELHKEGKFVQLGLSNYAAWEVAEIWTMCRERGWVRPTVYQAMYNAISKFHDFTWCVEISELTDHVRSENNRAGVDTLLSEIQDRCCDI